MTFLHVSIYKDNMKNTLKLYFLSVLLRFSDCNLSNCYRTSRRTHLKYRLSKSKIITVMYVLQYIPFIKFFYTCS